jgi:hypothetical protein
MQPISELTQTFQQGSTERTESTSDQPSPETLSVLTDKHMYQLWARMGRIYGHKWVSSYGEKDDGTWKRGLMDLTPMQLAHGLGKCVTRTDSVWPPSLPEFRAMCLPCADDLGIPTVQAAYLEACKAARNWDTHQFSHLAVYHAARETGTWCLTTMPEYRVQPIFERNYSVIIHRMLNGERLDKPIPYALPKKVSVRTPEAAQGALNDLQSILRGGTDARPA